MPDPQPQSQSEPLRTPLPPAPAPQGSYIPAVAHGGVAMSAGMTPRVDGQLAVRGIVGRDLDLPDARSAAGIAARNALSAVAEAAGGLSRIRRCLRLSVFIACADGFEDLSAVADGATAAIAEQVGPETLPVRSAIGVRALPSGAPVEVELTVAIAEQ
ncbi:MAG TPA: RidA family protein [Nocardioidaceae bacterium]|nr:RidA family protein [Nocardioidaceae bacterium]